MTGGLFLGVSIIALVLFLSLLWWGISNSRRSSPPLLATAQALPSGQNHQWINHYEYKLSDFLPAAPAPLTASASQKVGPAAQKKSAIAGAADGEDEELAQLAQAELDAEAAYYAARSEAEAQSPPVLTTPAETYDFPFDAPAPTATDKHNTKVKNELRAKRAAAARNSRLAVTGTELTKSQPA